MFISLHFRKYSSQHENFLEFSNCPKTNLSLVGVGKDEKNII